MALKTKRISLIVLSLLFILAICCHSCMTFRLSSKEVDNFFVNKKIPAAQHQYMSGFRTMHYVAAGDTTKPLVLFVHGSPGSLSAFIDFLADTSLLANAFLITADRPGFGYSNFGLAEPSLQKQAEALKPILEKYKKSRPVILVGHSLGGPLIATMAINYPNLVDGLVIVSGSIDPDLEPNEIWFRAPLASPFLSWILPRAFRASNDEIYQLKPELEKLKDQWNQITCPVIILHGTKDSLVPIKNTAFAKRMLTNAEVEFIIADDVDHFIPWSNPELINRAVLKMVMKLH